MKTIDPRIKQEQVFRDLEIFVSRIEHAIYELQLNKDISLTSIKFGDYVEVADGIKLSVRAKCLLNVTNPLMGFDKLIARRS